jgi:histidinol phosphatase-like PHP family hydrolase
MAEAVDQRAAMNRLNATYGTGFRLIRGIEANIGSDERLDLSRNRRKQFELVLAAPHSKLRTSDDQTDRLVAAIRNPQVMS